MMTPQEFVRAWLPDYEEKWQEALRSRPRALVHDVRVGFIEKYHSEALAAFAKAQREECATVYAENPGYEYISSIYEDILNTPIPTPKNE